MTVKMEDRLNKLAMDLFLSLTLHQALIEKYKSDEQVLEDWMKEQVCSTAEYLFDIAEA